MPTTEQTKQRFLKTGQVLKRFNISRSILDSLVERGKLRCVKFEDGGHRRFHIDEIERFEKAAVKKKG